MASYKPVVIQTYPKLGEKITQDTLYWKNFKTPVQIKEFGAVTKVDFSPCSPFNYAVTASSRIHIYGRYSQAPIKTFSRFKDTVYCATYRGDGQLLAAGGEEGGIQLFDISGRAPLRTFEGHTKAVHVVDFTAGGYRILSGADDYTSKLWDIPNGKEITSFSEHTDYVRCGCTSKVNDDLFVTGSYDHTVKMFDGRSQKSVLTIMHGQPVESVLLFPSGGLLVSAGGRYVKIWDILRGGQLLVSLRNHHKTVTCLCLTSSGQRLLSGSLDRHVKVYSTASYKVVHTFTYAASILSLALAPKDETLIVGMTNGVLNVRHRKSEVKKEQHSSWRRRPAYRTFVKGRNYIPKQADFVVQKSSKQFLKMYDKDLKSFQVSKALDRVIQFRTKRRHPESAVAIIQELNRRGTLANALAGRDEQQLNKVLHFLLKHIIEPRFTPALLNVAELVVDIYLPVAGVSSVVDRQFFQLQDLLEKEIGYQEELLEALGMMDMLFATMMRKPSTSIVENKPNGISGEQEHDKSNVST
ncbi:U3 small nucleolar RNA-associated protein 15 homolog [Ornithorhynchus anatinus]|uniref:U3 small nucleolar RNA-associated protein 15 homolog n=1 Tax=Ornithorhynchus anatinus TaxID=9258 RepID=F6PHA7_ORNAN|nr:U3 small nucleolar RNA-associated protein 15 homolog [Ornithorhynchus anatinus]XP_028925254.1 U3 small nucleolar RNA-associated protein 15 homolog [Ornithorhynchus anatinus]XP_028925261.1 U3 small nucleolar RNA-associated protein 15 homolog [Ornithorhynchus anatinus]